MNADAVTNQLPLCALFRRRMQKAWKPLQGGGYLPAVRKNHMQCILCKGNIYRKSLNSLCQNAHSSSLRFPTCSLRSASRSRSIHSYGNCGTAQARVDASNTLHIPDPSQHEYALARLDRG